jgi:hypothetical protein
MPMYEVLSQRIYLVRTREEATFTVEASSPGAAGEQVEAIACLDRQESGKTWDVLKTRETLKAVRICRVKRLPDDRPRPLPFSRRVCIALGLT